MPATPAISVVIPTFNRAKVVPAAIESVFAQSHPAMEIIVVDDGSSDDTRQVLASYGDRIRAISQENGGLSAARNTGIRAAICEWVAFLDDDDAYVPERLAIAAETIRLHPDIGVHATNTAIVNEDGSELDMFAIRGRHATEHMRVERPLEWVLGGCFFAQTLVARKDALVGAGLFRKTFYEDMDLFVRLAARGAWTVDVRKCLRLSGCPARISIYRVSGVRSRLRTSRRFRGFTARRWPSRNFPNAKNASSSPVWRRTCSSSDVRSSTRVTRRVPGSASPRLPGNTRGRTAA